MALEHRVYVLFRIRQPAAVAPDQVAAHDDAQLSQLSHYDLMVASHPPAERLAARLAKLLPGELNETVLLNSGSEAIEAALRIALTYWCNIGEKRDRVITLANGYHGSTSLAQQRPGCRSW